MFSVFKRTKIKEWELSLLKKTVSNLPDNISYPLLKQINAGLLKGVIKGLGDIPNYVCFKLNSDIYENFYDKMGRNFRITNIEVKVGYSSSIYTIFISHGVINGYSLSPFINGIDDNNFTVNAGKFKLIYRDNIDFQKISNILSKEELNLINSDDVYAIELNGKRYFHILDLEDGDFVGLDVDRNIYRITHDPYKVQLIKKDLKDVLTEGNQRSG